MLSTLFFLIKNKFDCIDRSCVSVPCQFDGIFPEAISACCWIRHCKSNYSALAQWILSGALLATHFIELCGDVRGCWRSERWIKSVFARCCELRLTHKQMLYVVNRAKLLVVVDSKENSNAGNVWYTSNTISIKTFKK